jgi:diaminopimelate epimerase
MKLPFFKYQATGNDFVILDNREKKYAFTPEQVQAICDRKFGIGADGLMLIEPDQQLDFNLQYYNSDGSQSLCGNGSRAAVSFASELGIVNGKTTFKAFDGPHDAELMDGGNVRLKMGDVQGVRRLGEDFFINTGSPHYIRVVEDAEAFPVYEQGKRIRYSEAFKPGGVNVNFVQLLENNAIFVRTYERGVENETLSCGTGVTAAALAASFRGLKSPVNIETLGGDLIVEFKFRPSDLSSGHAGIFTDVYLSGPAKMVFRGELEL